MINCLKIFDTVRDYCYLDPGARLSSTLFLWLPASGEYEFGECGDSFWWSQPLTGVAGRLVLKDNGSCHPIKYYNNVPMVPEDILGGTSASVFKKFPRCPQCAAKVENYCFVA